MMLKILPAVLGLMCLSVEVAVVSSQAYKVEVYFVTEKRVIDRYIQEAGGNQTQATINYNEELDYFIAEMNEMYSSLAHFGLNIQIGKRAFTILYNENVYSTSPANSGIALQLFQAWLDRRKAYQNYSFDAAILLTNIPLYGNGPTEPIEGVSWVGAACDKSASMAIVTHDMTYDTIVTMAHELAHCLGASHDHEDSYIMGPDTPSNSPNRWNFSSTSFNTMGKYVRGLSPNCLLQNQPQTVQVNTDNVSDALADPNRICKRALKNNQAFVYLDSWGSGQSICREVSCGLPRSESVEMAIASDGMICGRNKRCDNGKCVSHPDSKSSTANPKCLWGDQARILIYMDASVFEGTCPQYIQRYGRYLCQYKDIQNMCCKTCPKSRRRREVPGQHRAGHPRVIRPTAPKTHKPIFGGDCVSRQRHQETANNQRNGATDEIVKDETETPVMTKYVASN